MTRGARLQIGMMSSQQQRKLDRLAMYHLGSQAGRRRQKVDLSKDALGSKKAIETTGLFLSYKRNPQEVRFGTKIGPDEVGVYQYKRDSGPKKGRSRIS